MKKLLPTLLMFSTIAFLANCSSHPEIKPYEAPVVSLEDDVSAAVANDSVFEDAIQSGKPFDLAAEPPQMSETPSSLEAPAQPPLAAAEVAVADPSVTEVQPAIAPVVTQPIRSVTRRPASGALTNGFYIFSRDCVMRMQPNAGSVGAGQVPAGKKLWLDVHSNSWLKAYKKAGTVYIPSSCVK